MTNSTDVWYVEMTRFVQKVYLIWERYVLAKYEVKIASRVWDETGMILLLKDKFVRSEILFKHTFFVKPYVPR